MAACLTTEPSPRPVSSCPLPATCRTTSSPKLNGGRYGNQRILSPEGIAQLHHGTAAIDGTDSYAVGWVASTGVDDKRFLWHGGDTGGSHAYMAVLPRTGWGVVVLTNGSNDLRPNGQDFIAQGVIARLLGHQPYTPVGLLAQPYTLLLLAILVGGLLQVTGIARTLLQWRRWSRHSPHRPPTRRQLAIRVGVPFALNAAWATLLLLVVPALLGLPLFTFVHPLSDWGTTDVTLGILAVAWGMLVRPTATLLLLRHPHRSSGGGTPAAGSHAPRERITNATSSDSVPDDQRPHAARV